MPPAMLPIQISSASLGPWGDPIRLPSRTQLLQANWVYYVDTVEKVKTGVEAVLSTSYIIPVMQHMHPRSQAHALKMWQHPYVVIPQNYPHYIIWMDPTLQLKPDVSVLWFLDMLNDGDIACFQHWEGRSGPYAEATIVKETQRADPVLIDQHVRYMRSIGVKESGMVEGYFYITKNTSKMQMFFWNWWNEQMRFPHTWDQLSFLYIAERHNVKVNRIDGNARNHPWFTYYPHGVAPYDVQKCLTTTPPTR